MKPQHYNVISEKEKHSKRIYVRETQSVNNKKKRSGTVYKQILINAKLKTGKSGQKAELTRRSPLGRQRTGLDHRAIEDEEEDSK
jgi:hypothetical protein